MRALPKKFYILVPHLHDLSSAVSPVLTSGLEALQWVMPMGHVQWAGSEGSLKAYQLESWVTLLEKKLLQKSKDTTNNRIMLCLCFLLVPTTKESQKKVRENNAVKFLSFQPNIRSTLLLFYVHELLAETKNWLSGWSVTLCSEGRTCILFWQRIPYMYIDYIQASSRTEENTDKRNGWKQNSQAP